MSLDKAIEHGKERRTPYRKSKRFDATCRNHGACPWCMANRLFHRIKTEKESNQDMEIIRKGEEV